MIRSMLFVSAARGNIANPQLRPLRRWPQVEFPVGTIDGLLPPHNLEKAPALGQHTAEILAELDSTQGALPQ